MRAAQGRAPAHPVKRELWRLLAGVAFCALGALVAYGVLDRRLQDLRLAEDRFHAPALGMSAELASALASMTMPPGLPAHAVEQLDNEVAFVASVTRDFGRAQSLLRSLIALHEQVAAPGFAPALRRLRRAADELQDIDHQFRGDPLALARLVSLRPVYASVVVQQMQRLHEQARRELAAQQSRTQQQFVVAFSLVALLLAVALALQLRRSLRGIDGILGREQEARDGLSALLAAVPDLWFVLDARGRFVRVSDARHPHLDTPWPLLKGQPFRLVPAPAPSWAASRGLPELRHEPVALDYEAGAHPAQPRAFEARLVPTGKEQWLYLSRDISERKQAERTLARSNEELERLVAARTQQLTIARDAAEEANRSKSEFLSRMSHELRTPMNAVLGFAQLMGLDPSVSASQRQSLDHILRAGKHLLHLINDVLDLAHVESGHLTLSPEALGVAELAQEVVALMQPLAQSHRVHLHHTLPNGVVVRGDRLRVKQVLLNLCSNAIKYNRPGGWVRLDAEPAGDGRVRIAVEDNGQGISADGQARLFEPFSRLGAEHSAVEGTGIGLSISKRLVELMDGRIGVASTPGEGSRFWIELPGDRFAAPPPPESVEPDAAGAAALRPATVLYVEDNPDNLALVVRIVERHPGVRLLTSPSASLGFELALVHRPDLVLADLHLGEGSGYALLDRLRAHPVTQHIPAVAVTANAMPMEAARAQEAGFAAYFTKPIDVGRFDELLRTMLGRA